MALLCVGAGVWAYLCPPNVSILVHEHREPLRRWTAPELGARAPPTDGARWTLWLHSGMDAEWRGGKSEIPHKNFLARLGLKTAPIRDVYSVQVIREGNRAVWLPLLWSPRAAQKCRLECPMWPRLECDPQDRITFGHLSPDILSIKDSAITQKKEYLLEKASLSPKCVGRAALELGRNYESERNWAAAASLYNNTINAPFVHPAERWFARYRRAVSLLNGHQHPLEQLEALFLDAIEDPGGSGRREPYYYLARLWRTAERPNRARIYASAGLALPPIESADGHHLYIEPVLHGWALREEHALALYYAGYRTKAASEYTKALSNLSIPAGDAHRMRVGLAHSQKE